MYADFIKLSIFYLKWLSHWECFPLADKKRHLFHLLDLGTRDPVFLSQRYQLDSYCQFYHHFTHSKIFFEGLELTQ